MASGPVNPDEVEVVVDGESPADQVYRWTIRALYATAIALNVWMLWDVVADESDTARVKAQARAVWDRITSPVREAKVFRSAVNHVLFEAEQIVEATDAG